MGDEFLTVSELNCFIRDVLNSGLPKSVWVCGEIQGYDRSKDKKHVFFELCEKDLGSREIVARIGMVIFAQARPRIEATLKKAENAFELKDDIEVKFLCKVDFYPGHGQVRLIVENIDPVHTLGKIAQDRQRLIAFLRQKGVLEKNKQVPLPEVVLNIGLITSYDSAAFHDFTSELGRSGYAFKIFLVNALMQGKNAEASVIRALKILGDQGGLDVIVITRGGGSIAELSCFDSEKIAMAIAASRLPVLSGIGHQINTTVTDLTAHTYAKTPTAIAQLLVGRIKAFMEQVDERHGRIIEALRWTLKARRTDLKDKAFLLQSQTVAQIKDRHRHLAGIEQSLKRAPAAFKSSARSLMETTERLKKIIHLRLEGARTKIKHCEKMAQLADPQHVLRRGFTITRSKDGVLLRNLKDTENINHMTTQLLDGIIESEIKKGPRAQEPGPGG